MRKRALSMVFLALIVTSCNRSRPADSTPEPPQELIMYLVGAEPELHGQFQAKLNEYLLEDFNVTMEVRYVDWSNFATDYRLIFVSGEQADLVYTASWCFYYDLAREGELVPLDELLDTHPAVRETLPAEAWEMARVNGSIYAVPANQHRFATLGLLYRTDLVDCPLVVDSLDTLEEYLQAVVRRGDIVPWDLGRNDAIRIWLMFAALSGYRLLPDAAGLLSYDPTDPEPVLVPLVERGGFREFLYMLRRWNRAGYWRTDAVSRNSESAISFEQGNSAVVFVQPTDARDLAERMLAAHPDWELRYWPFSDVRRAGGYADVMQDAMAVPASSDDPELAFQILEAIRTERRYFDLFFYGIPGIHYTISDSGVLEPIEQSGGWNMSNWGFRNYPMNRESARLWSEWDEIEERLDSYTEYDTLAGFVADFTAIAFFRDQIGDAQQSLLMPLSLGAYPDPDEGLGNFIASAYDGGFTAYVEALNNQVRGYLAR
jgi:putative aldouronate transport system substrate-binding protein